jgi:hypothetical protein
MQMFHHLNHRLKTIQTRFSFPPHLTPATHTLEKIALHAPHLPTLERIPGIGTGWIQLWEEKLIDGTINSPKVTP